MKDRCVGCALINGFVVTSIADNLPFPLFPFTFSLLLLTIFESEQNYATSSSSCPSLPPPLTQPFIPPGLPSWIPIRSSSLRSLAKKLFPTRTLSFQLKRQLRQLHLQQPSRSRPRASGNSWKISPTTATTRSCSVLYSQRRKRQRDMARS